jgi:glucose/arabinose dehydrogenase
MRVTALVAALAGLLAACNGETPAPTASADQPGSATTPTRGAPVQQASTNKADAVPAFPEQTRAPEAKTNVTLNVEVLAEGIENAWAGALLPDDGSLLVTSQTGKLWLVTPGKPKTEVTGVPKVDARGQGGLLDISVGPDFMTNHTVYFTFSEDRGGGKNGTSLAKATLSADRKKLENVSVVFQQQPAWASTAHYGSNIEWDSAGNVYITLGERSDPEPRQLSQDLDTHIGKVVKLKADGTPADGNPFIGQANTKPEIWSYGHRNVQGAAIHPDTGKLWTIEHGPRGGDEINIPEAGKNYGWPVISYGIEYAGGPIGEGITVREGMEQPIYYWDPVIAPGDMIFYKGNLFPWKGDLLIGSLGPNQIVRLDVEGDRVTGEERLLTDQGRIRDIIEAPDGALYVVAQDAGKLLRVTPQSYPR